MVYQKNTPMRIAKLMACAFVFGMLTFLFIATALAADADGTTTVDLSGAVSGVGSILYGALAFLAVVAYNLLSKIPLFNKLVTKEQYQKLVDPLLDEAVAFGVGKLSKADWLKISTKNDAVAVAIQYAYDHGADILKKFGITEELLEQKIEAKLVKNGWDQKPGEWDNS